MKMKTKNKPSKNWNLILKNGLKIKNKKSHEKLLYCIVLQKKTREKWKKEAIESNQFFICHLFSLFFFVEYGGDGSFINGKEGRRHILVFYTSFYLSSFCFSYYVSWLQFFFLISVFHFYIDPRI